jgi:hypothetical protein
MTTLGTAVEVGGGRREVGDSVVRLRLARGRCGFAHMFAETGKWCMAGLAVVSLDAGESSCRYRGFGIGVVLASLS